MLCSDSALLVVFLYCRIVYVHALKALGLRTVSHLAATGVGTFFLSPHPPPHTHTLWEVGPKLGQFTGQSCSLMLWIFQNCWVPLFMVWEHRPGYWRTASSCKALHGCFGSFASVSLYLFHLVATFQELIKGPARSIIDWAQQTPPANETTEKKDHRHKSSCFSSTNLLINSLFSSLSSSSPSPPFSTQDLQSKAVCV